MRRAIELGRRAGGPRPASRRRASRSRKRAPMILMIDNYDSFTFNLVQALQAAGAEVRVVRNDQITAAEIDGARRGSRRGPARDRHLARARRPGLGRRVDGHGPDRRRPADPAPRRVPRDAVDGCGVGRVDRPRPDAGPRRSVRGRPRRHRPAGGHARDVPGRALPLADGRPGDAARRPVRLGDEPRGTAWSWASATARCRSRASSSTRRASSRPTARTCSRTSSGWPGRARPRDSMRRPARSRRTAGRVPTRPTRRP